MKICITSQGNNLDSLVDARFGRCAYFIIYDTDKESFESFPNPNVASPSGAGISSAQFVIDKGASVVLTGNVGPNSFGVFQTAGVEVYTGLSGLTVKEAVEKFKKGEFKPTPNPNVPGHFGMGGPGNINPGQNIPYPGQGVIPPFGMGRGMGMGRGRFFAQQPFYPGLQSQVQLSKEQELQFLKQQLNFLTQQIEAVNKRIQELEEGERKERKMRVAIAKDNDSVSSHFGRCAEYEIVDIEEGAIKQRKTISNPGHFPGFLPEYLSKMKVEVIICGGMGPRAQELFREKNIKIIFAEGELDKVIDDFIRGTLEETQDKCEH